MSLTFLRSEERRVGKDVILMDMTRASSIGDAIDAIA